MTTRKKLIIYLVSTVVIFLIVTSVLYIKILAKIDPRQYKEFITAILKETLNSEVALGDTSVVVFSDIRITIKDIKIEDPLNEEKGSIYIDKVSAAIQIIPFILSNNIVIKELIIDKPSLSIKRYQSGDISFLQDIKVSKADGNNGHQLIEIPVIKKIVIKDGGIDFKDSLLNDTLSVKNINLLIKKPLLKRFFKFALSLSLSNDNKEAAFFSMHGKVVNLLKDRNKLDVTNMKIQGEADARSLYLPKIMRYIPIDMKSETYNILNEIFYKDSVDIHINYFGGIFDNIRSSGNIKVKDSNKMLIDYELKVEDDTIDISRLNIELGKEKITNSMLFKKISHNYMLINARVNSTYIDILHLKLFSNMFPDKLASFIDEHISGGEVKISLFDFTGVLPSMKSLYMPEYSDQLKANIEFKEISGDYLSTNIKSLNGKIILKNTVFYLSDISFEVGGSIFKKLNGEIRDPFNTPDIDANLYGHLDLIEWIQFVKKNQNGTHNTDSFLNNTEIYSGYADVNIAIKGEINEGVKYIGPFSVHNLNMRYSDVMLKDINGNIELKEDKVSLDKLALTAYDLPFVINGDLINYDKSFSMDLKIDTSLEGNFLKKGVLKDTQFDGGAPVSFMVTGSPERFTFQGNADIGNLSVGYSDWLKKEKGVEGNVSFNGEIDNLKKDLLLTESSIFLRSKEVVSGGGTFSLKNEGINLKIRIPETPASIFKGVMTIFKDTAEEDISGTIDGEFKIKNDRVHKEDIVTDGFINIKGVSIPKSEDFHKIARLNAILKFKNSRLINIDNLTADIGKSKVNLDIRINKREKKEDDSISFKLKSPQIELEDVISLIKKESRYDYLNGTIDIQEVRYNNFIFKDVRGEIDISKNDIIIKPMRLKLYEGYSDLTLRLKKEGEHIKDFFVEIQGDNFKAEDLLNDITDKFKGGITGRLKLSADINGSGGNIAEYINKLNGKASILLTKGKIDRRKFSNEDSENKGETLENSIIDYDEIRGDFDIKDGIAATEDFLLMIRGLKIMSAVGNIDLGSKILDCKACIRTHIIADEIISKIPIIGGIIKHNPNIMLQCFNINGDAASPVVLEVAPKSLGSKLLEVFKGLFEAPVDLIMEPLSK